MVLWTRRRGWQVLTLALIAVGLVAGGALVAYADSIDRNSLSSAPGQAQGDATLTATAMLPPDSAQASVPGAESAILQTTPTTTPTATVPPTVPPTAPPPPPTSTPVPAPGNVIVNGGFEQGFLPGQGVGVGWGRFQNGNVFAGWYDDTWDKVVYEGDHAQLLELVNAQEANRYAGIFQPVNVVPNTNYLLTLHGLVRSDSGSPEASNFGFRLQYGIDYTGGADWQSANISWIELPWDDQPRTDPKGENQYRMETFTATVRTQSNRLTLFIRGLKKWPDAVEGNYDIDGVSLVGLQPGTQPPPTQVPPTQPPGGQPTATAVPGMPVTGNAFAFLENPVVVVPSIALLIVLIGGAVWGLTRRRL